MMQLTLSAPAGTSLTQIVHKAILEDSDMRGITSMIVEGIREGSYGGILREKKSADVLGFVRTLVTRCELRNADGRRRAAALLAYAVEGVVVGFAVVAEATSKAFKPAVEILMVGVASAQRGMGHGAAILDHLMKMIANTYFHIVVRCPADNSMLFAMLVTRGFVSVSRYENGRTLLFLSKQLPAVFEAKFPRYRRVE